MLLRPLLFIICLLPINVVKAVDQAREQLMAAELIERIGAHERLWLNDNSGQFLSLKVERPEVIKRGGVILLHDMDAHPDWPEVISPLRHGLPISGWPTLSIQLPLLSKGVALTAHNQQKIIDQANARIIAAVEYFTGIGIYNIVFIGHGLGATAISHFLSGELAPRHAVYIKAFIAIRFRIHQRLPKAYLPRKLLQLKTALPILDILGTRESPDIQQHARERKAVAIQAQQFNYRQARMSSANNNFWAAEGLLLSRVTGWLRSNAAGTEVVLESLNQSYPQPLKF